MTTRPTPEDWFRVLWAARAVLADFELDDSAADVEDTAAEIELRESMRRVAEHVGVPVKMLELDPEHPDLPFNPNLTGDA
jgi:hypothetical protein